MWRASSKRPGPMPSSPNESATSKDDPEGGVASGIGAAGVAGVEADEDTGAGVGRSRKINITPIATTASESETTHRTPRPTVAEIVFFNDSGILKQSDGAIDSGDGNLRVDAGGAMIQFFHVRMIVSRLQHAGDHPPLFGHAHALVDTRLFKALVLVLIHSGLHMAETATGPTELAGA